LTSVVQHSMLPIELEGHIFHVPMELGELYITDINKAKQILIAALPSLKSVVDFKKFFNRRILKKLSKNLTTLPTVTTDYITSVESDIINQILTVAFITNLGFRHTMDKDSSKVEDYFNQPDELEQNQTTTFEEASCEYMSPVTDESQTVCHQHDVILEFANESTQESELKTAAFIAHDTNCISPVSDKIQITHSDEYIPLYGDILPDVNMVDIPTNPLLVQDEEFQLSDTILTSSDEESRNDTDGTSSESYCVEDHTRLFEDGIGGTPSQMDSSDTMQSKSDHFLPQIDGGSYKPVQLGSKLVQSARIFRNTYIRGKLASCKLTLYVYNTKLIDDLKLASVHRKAGPRVKH